MRASIVVASATTTFNLDAGKMAVLGADVPAAADTADVYALRLKAKCSADCTLIVGRNCGSMGKSTLVNEFRHRPPGVDVRESDANVDRRLR